MYNECLSEIEDEIYLINGNNLKCYGIDYEYVNYDKRVIHNENANNIINIEKYKKEFNDMDKCTDE